MRRAESLVLTLLLLPPVLAVANDETDRIRIQADNLKMQLDDGISTYSGNVRFERQDMILSGDRIVLQQGEADRMLVSVEGSPATYQQQTAEGSTQARSKRMRYDENTRILIMTESARLEQDDQVIESDMIEYDTERKVLLAGGDQQGNDEATNNSRVNIILNRQSETR